MPNQLRNSLQIYSTAFETRQAQTEWYKAVIVEHEGNVWYSRNELLIWHQPIGSQYIKPIYCESVDPPIAGTPIVCTRWPWDEDYSVFGVDQLLRQATGNAYRQTNGPREMEPAGRNPIWLYDKMLVPLSIVPKGDAYRVLIVGGKYIWTDGSEKTLLSYLYDLESLKPSANSHRYIGFELKPDNTVSSVVGTTSLKSSGNPAIPEVTAGSRMLGYIYFDGAVSSFVSMDDVTNLKPVWTFAKKHNLTATTNPAVGDDELDGYGIGSIWINTNTPAAFICISANTGSADWNQIDAAGGSGGWPFDLVLTVDPIDSDADYSAIQDAIDDSGAGDVILVGPGTYSETLIVGEAITIRGVSRERCIITGSSAAAAVTITAGAVLENLTIQQPQDTQNAINVTTTDGAIIRNCDIAITATTGTGGYAINSVVSVTVDNCRVTNPQNKTTRGVRVFGSGKTATIIGGSYDTETSSAYNVEAASSATAVLRGPTLVDGLITGTWSGWYQDATGKIITPNYIPVPENYAFTRRSFALTSGANQIGFEDSQSTPYVPGGNFSLSTPANNYLAESATYRHFLWLYNFHGSSPLYVQWTSSTAKNNLAMRWAVSPNGAVGGDTLAAEIRFWAVQSPGASDKYWALRFMQYKTSKPQYPLWAELCYGTGVTFPDPSVAIFSSSPFVAGVLLGGTLTVNNPGTPSFGVDPINLSEGFKSLGGSGGLAGQPGSFKTIRFYIPPANFVQAWIDDMVIT